ncbi:MAG: AAC(3) family N-acetyltransferase [Archangiaceae bacterium]|nr:AAC(3) family N-acetyltransferase [Archangiaceae bacterium]
MVHASMRRVGGRAEHLVEQLLSVLGPGGTLCAYVDFRPTDAVPFFDVERSPAMEDHGVLAEVIRCWPGAVRSANPGASVAAIGARAGWLCAEHPLNYGYGEGSPFAKLVERDGEVLLLGSDFDHVTLVHHAEHLATLPDKRVITSEFACAPTGAVVRIEEFDTSEPVVAGMPEDSIGRITRAFVDAGLARRGQVGGAQAFVLPARAFTRFAVDWLESNFGAGATSSRAPTA